MATSVQTERPTWQKVAFPPIMLYDKYRSHHDVHSNLQASTASTASTASPQTFFGGEDRMNIKVALMILFVIFLIVLVVSQFSDSETVYTCVIATGIAYTVVFIIDKLCESNFTLGKTMVPIQP